MQQDFYTVEGLATQLLSSAFINLNNIPDYRLRPMLRILPSLSWASSGGLQACQLKAWWLPSVVLSAVSLP